MKIAISTESTLDLTEELIKKYDISIIPYEIILGNEVFKDGEKSTEEIFEYVNKNNVLPKTTALNEYTYINYFQSLLTKYDAVIHITLSSAITSSSENAVKASKELQNVYVIDSKSLSTGIALLAIYARELSYKNIEPSIIYEKVLKRVSSLQVSFIIERLDYLYKGGRCSSLALFGANLLRLRPRIIVKKDGSMCSDKKYRGKMEQCVKSYCMDTLKEFNTPDKSIVFLTYTTATKEMSDIAKKILIENGFSNILETRAGGTVASHCGANTLGILYFNDGNTINND